MNLVVVGPLVSSMHSGKAWRVFFRDLRIWRDKAEAQKKEVEAYALFVSRTKPRTTQVLKEAA